MTPVSDIGGLLRGEEAAAVFIGVTVTEVRTRGPWPVGRRSRYLRNRVEKHPLSAATGPGLGAEAQPSLLSPTVGDSAGSKPRDAEPVQKVGATWIAAKK
ncbi:hypothetical protein Are01nite_57510 [Actinoplanes regularis]|nr:hypothetical protein Are01nite_57510 [Actinoplanes regularis]